MKYYPFLFIAVYLFILNTNLAQDQVFALRQSRDQGFTFIDTSGKKLFELAPGHNPSVLSKKEPFKLGNFYSIDFSANVLAVNDGLHSYLIDRTGKKTADLQDSLNWISPIENGFIRVYEPYQGRRNASMIFYINKEGKACFEGKRFWEASIFRAGHAIVRKETESEWLLIDSTGQTVINLSDSLGNIRNYSWQANNKLWRLNIKQAEKSYSYKVMYLRPKDGALNAKVSELVATKKPSDFPDTGLSLDSQLIARVQKLDIFTWIPMYQTEDYGYYLFEDKTAPNNQRKTNLYNHHYELISFNTDSINYEAVDIMGKYIVLKKQPLNASHSFVFVDTEDLSFGLEVDQLTPSMRIDGDLLFYETKSSFIAPTVHKIVHLKGHTIYEPNANKRVFKNLDAALAASHPVKELQLDGVSVLDLLQLKKLKELEVLKIKNLYGHKLPTEVFSSLSQLKSFRLSHCEDLTQLPPDFASLQALSYLQINDCPKLQGLSLIIPQLTALKKVRTDYPFSHQQRQNFKTQYPHIHFEEMLVVDK